MTKKVEKKTPFNPINENLPFVNFQETPKFTGMYKNTLRLGDVEEKQFDVHIFVDMESGEEKFVTASHSINKALQKAKLDNPDGISEFVFEINFLEKIILEGGHQFNKFNIGYCSLEDYETFNKK